MGEWSIVASVIRYTAKGNDLHIRLCMNQGVATVDALLRVMNIYERFATDFVAHVRNFSTRICQETSAAFQIDSSSFHG